jgi:alkylhydroperoxidase family enzyme
MVDLDYSAARVTVREDLEAAHRLLWERLRSPGTWWTGGERVAAAAESRAAESCSLCKTRKGALSPHAVQGRHAGGGELAEVPVDVIHRVRTDPGRLSRAWYDRVLASGLHEGPYVELVAVVAMTAGVDSFARALGIAPFPLPEPLAGEPSRYRPSTARPNGAWVATIAGGDAIGSESDLYRELAIVPNIASALSLVPDEVRTLRRLSEAHYMGIEHVPDPTFRCGTLDRMQMELVAARVSALNQCFY